MQNSKYDVSIVVTAHAEGTLAHRTMRSIEETMRDAQVNGVTCELLAVLDCPDDATIEYFESSDLEELRILPADFRDLGLSRNFAAERASGQYVAFIDADDLWCRTWITRAFQYARQFTSPFNVFHASMGVFFEARRLIKKYVPSDDDQFDWSRLVEDNRWSSNVFVPRYVFLDIPQAPRAETGFGYEDWQWYCELLHRGVAVRIVDQTCLFIRQKAVGSLRLKYQATQSLLSPTPLLNPATIGQGEHKDDSAGTLRTLPPAKRSALRSVAKNLLSRVPFAYRGVQRLYDIGKRIRQARANRVRELPEWLHCAWCEIHEIEPQLHPDASSLSWYSWNRTRDSAIGDAYRDLCSDVPIRASHVFLLPWLKRGGADLEALNYIRALSENRWADGILVVQTEAADSPWTHRLPNDVAVVDFGSKTAHLSDDERDFLLGTMLVQLEPKVIHLVNSQVGYRVLRKFGQALSHLSCLYASVFCEDITESGKIDGYPFQELPHCFAFLDAVFCDNRRFLERLENWYGFDPSKLLTHYQPIDANQRRERHSDDGRLSILWASRLDRQKHPELLVEIASLAQDKPFDFHVYGYPLTQSDGRTLRQFRRLPNVRFHGRYDDFQSLPAENFDVFLYTSRWDGMPNVVLEALAAELALVTSEVGGVAELVEHEENGILVPMDSPAGRFVEALESLHADRQRMRKMAECGRQSVSENHNWDRFLDALRNVPNYTQPALSSAVRESV